MTETTTLGAKTDACVYILHMLLQRLERSQPGIVISLLEGTKADFAACGESSSERVFTQAIAMLEMVHAQNQLCA